MHVQRHFKPTRNRRGVLSMELLLTLPILGVLLMGLFEFSLLFFAQGDIAEACRAGARRAAVQGATVEDVEAEVVNHLSPRLQQCVHVDADCGEHPGDVVAVAVKAPMGAAAPDMLWCIGFSLQGQNFQCESRMRKE